MKAYLKQHETLTTIQYLVPTHMQKYYNELTSECSFPITEQSAKTILSLPRSPELEEYEQKLVVDLLQFLLWAYHD